MPMRWNPDYEQKDFVDEYGNYRENETEEEPEEEEEDDVQTV